MSPDQQVAQLEGAGRVYSHAERMRVVFGILTCMMLAALDQTVVLPAIPQMAANLHGAGHLSWVVSAYLLTATATTPIYGKLSDQLGRREVLIPALVFFCVASVLCALSSSVLMLILARALQGIGGGALLAVSQAAVADVIPPRERGKYQAWFSMVWTISSVAGPIAGGFVAQALSWRWIFWFNVPLALLAMGFSARGLAGLKPTGLRSRIDYSGALLMMAAVAAALFGLSTGGVDVPWLSAEVLGVFALAVVILAVLVLQQRQAEAPLFPGALLVKPAFRALLEVSFANAAAMFGAIFLLPLMLQWLYHQGASASGLELVPFLFGSTAGAYGAGQMLRRTGRGRVILMAGVATSAAGFLVLAVAPGAGTLFYPISVSALFGLGIGCVMPVSLVQAQSLAARRDMGAATGLLMLMRAMGGAFGATLVGALLALAHSNLHQGFRYGFCACATLQIVAMVIAWRMKEMPLRSSLEGATASEA
ncbi:MDR family MFS transporter [Acidocella sp.]|uniref:MDR family MFS transporter n=1 Tax=Acidocella sp. TaxID=50710 RepID=UPI002F3E410A